jgi:hypothetical protein
LHVAEPQSVTLSEYVESSLEVLSRETPRQFAEFRAQLGAFVVSVSAGDTDSFVLDMSGRPPWVKPFHRAGVNLRLSHSAIRAFAAGELSLEAALDSGRASLDGDAGDVIRLMEALRAWLHGALRSPTLPTLRIPLLEDCGE